MRVLEMPAIPRTRMACPYALFGRRAAGQSPALLSGPAPVVIARDALLQVFQRAFRQP